MIAIVEIKNNFGSEAIYPACNNSRLIAKLANTKTLTRETIQVAKELGFKFETKQQLI